MDIISCRTCARATCSYFAVCPCNQMVTAFSHHSVGDKSVCVYVYSHPTEIILLLVVANFSWQLDQLNVTFTMSLSRSDICITCRLLLQQCERSVKKTSRTLLCFLIKRGISVCVKYNTEMGKQRNKYTKYITIVYYREQEGNKSAELISVDA